jgi:hypothetical protein
MLQTAFNGVAQVKLFNFDDKKPKIVQLRGIIPRPQLQGFAPGPLGS